MHVVVQQLHNINLCIHAQVHFYVVVVIVVIAF